MKKIDYVKSAKNAGKVTSHAEAFVVATGVYFTRVYY